MNKKILINDNCYDLELLSKKSDYFLAMLNFESENIIDLSYRDIAYEIIIKILLNLYVFDKDYILNYDEIMDLQNELMLKDNFNILTIEDMCNTILNCVDEIKKINDAIQRYQNNKLTKKQKNSESYSKQYWKNIYYLDLSLSLEENENIYKLNDLLQRDIYEGYLNFKIIKKAYNYRDLLKLSNYLKFAKYKGRYIINFFDIGNFLNINNNVELVICDTSINQKSFKNYIYSDHIKKLCLVNCTISSDVAFIKIENVSIYWENGDISKNSSVYSQDMAVIFNTCIFPFLKNLEYIEIKNLKIKGKRHATITAKIKFPIFDLINIKCDFDEYYTFIDIESNND